MLELGLTNEHVIHIVHGGRNDVFREIAATKSEAQIDAANPFQI